MCHKSIRNVTSDCEKTEKRESGPYYPDFILHKHIIQSVLSFCISLWFGNCSDGDMGKLSKIVNCAKRLGCVNMKHLEELYEDAVHAKFDKIWSNDNHPLHNCFRLLPHGVRLSVPGSRTNRLRDAFVAKATQFYNN